MIKMIESCWNRGHDNRAVLGSPPLVRVEISQPSQKQGPEVAAHQFLADPDEFVNEALAFGPPPSAFFVAFPPNNTPVADFPDRQCVLVPFASPKIGLDRLRIDRALWKSQTQTNRAPVRDVEMSVVILEQGVHAPVEIAEGVGILPADARDVGAAGTTPGIVQPFVRDRCVDGRELVILILISPKWEKVSHGDMV